MRKLFLFLWTVFLGMLGGQKEKSARRFGIPFLALTFGKPKFNLFPAILMGIVLSIGYGENSWLMDLFDNDFVVRIVYSILLSLPFLFYGFRKWTISTVILVLAFQVHAGSIGHIGWFGDILIEDIARYSALAFLLIMTLL